MNTLDLAIEDAVWIYGLAGGPSEPVGKLPLGLALRLAECIAKALVTGERLEQAPLGEVRDPTGANALGNRAGERRVRQQQPPPRCGAVGLVTEALGKHFCQILDGHRAQQL